MSKDIKLHKGQQTEDQELLKPALPGAEFTRSDTWRVLKIQSEIVSGFDHLAGVGDAVAVFGSARTPIDHPYYQLALETGKELARAGLAVITGGGPGIMQAANQGAREEKGLSIGCNIELPFEQEANPYLDININFHYFFVRKLMLVKYSRAFIILPGGFGTIDELFEALTLTQTKKMKRFPVILMGNSYWKGLIDWLRDTMLDQKMISPGDLELMYMTDSPHEAVEIIKTTI